MVESSLIFFLLLLACFWLRLRHLITQYFYFRSSPNICRICDIMANHIYISQQVLVYNCYFMWLSQGLGDNYKASLTV